MIHKVGRYLSALLLISQSAHQAQKYLRENHSPPGTLPPASVAARQMKPRKAKYKAKATFTRFLDVKLITSLAPLPIIYTYM